MCSVTGDTILHEMGHALGIGTLWSLNNVINNAETEYTGVLGAEGYCRQVSPPALHSVWTGFVNVG